MVTKINALGWRTASLVPPLLTLLAFGAFVACYLTDRGLYVSLIKHAGVALAPGGHPFIDTKFVMAQIECWRQGIDVYAVNPCDPLGRLHDYSPLWLRLGFIPVEQIFVNPLGILIDLVFLGSLFLLPLPRFRPFDCMVLTLAMVSQTTIFGLERGNTDLLMFAFCVLAGDILLLRLPQRGLGYAVVMIAGALKFYPLVLLGLALRERLRVLFIITVVSAAGMGLFVWWYAAELPRALANVYVGYFGDMWGATTLVYNGRDMLLYMLRGFIAGRPALEMVVGHVFPAALLAVICVVVARRAIRIALTMDFAAAFAALPKRESIFLVMGSALACGCFFGHENIRYRAIVLLMALPGLLSMARATASPRCRSLLLATSAAIAFLMWFMLLGTLAGSYYFELWLVQQAVWWWVVTVFGAVLFRFGLQSDLWQLYSRRMLRARPAS